MESALEAIFQSDDELSDYDDEDTAIATTNAMSSVLCAAGHQPDRNDDNANANTSLSFLEDGEIGPASGSLPLDDGLRFIANDLDAAVRNAKKKPGRRKKGKKGRPREAKDIDAGMRFLSQICRRLKEPKAFLIEAAVQRLGVDVVRDLVQEVESIEKHGGQTTVDGKRRRTPGGVLWNVLRSRYEEDYKAIMAAGKAIEKQRKRKVEGDCMVIDGQPPTKRRRTGATGSFTAPAAQVKKTGMTVWPSRNGQTNFIQSKLDPDNSQTHTQAVCAWAEGVKRQKHKLGCNDVEMYDDVMKRKPASIAERLRVPVQYDDLVET